MGIPWRPRTHVQSPDFLSYHTSKPFLFFFGDKKSALLINYQIEKVNQIIGRAGSEAMLI